MIQTWKVWSVDTATGAKKGLVTLKEGTWARALNSSGAGRGSFMVGDKDSFGMPGKYLTNPVESMLVFEFGGIPLYAGVIWTRDYNMNDSTVEVTYADVWSILGKRLVVAYHAEGTQKVHLVFPDLSLETQLKRIIETAVAGAMFGLPLVLPADVAGVYTKTYKGYTMKRWQDAAQDIIDTEYGPDLDFQPRWNPANPKFLQLVVNIGVPVPGLLVFNASVEDSGISDVHVKEDATEVANHVLATGEGSEVELKVKSSIHGASPYPALVKVISNSDEKDLAALKANANADLATFSYPTEQWSFSIQAGKAHGVTELRPGLGVRVNVQDDPWLEDGERHLRLIGYSGDLTPKVSLEFQPGEVA